MILGQGEVQDAGEQVLVAAEGVVVEVGGRHHRMRQAAGRQRPLDRGLALEMRYPGARGRTGDGGEHQVRQLGRGGRIDDRLALLDLGTGSGLERGGERERRGHSAHGRGQCLAVGEFRDRELCACPGQFDGSG